MGASAAGEKGSAFLLIFQKLGGVSAFKNWKTQKKNVTLTEELLTALCLFFLHLLPPAVTLASYPSAIEETLFLSILANLFTSRMSCMLYGLISVAFRGCAHLFFSKYITFS